MFRVISQIIDRKDFFGLKRQKNKQINLLDDELKDILNDVDLLREEKLWTKMLNTEGAKVKHEKEHWTGSIIVPWRNKQHINGWPLVQVDTQDGSNIQRWVNPLLLAPFQEERNIIPFPR